MKWVRLNNRQKPYHFSLAALTSYKHCRRTTSKPGLHLTYVALCYYTHYIELMLRKDRIPYVIREIAVTPRIWVTGFMDTRHWA
jgi:hypothetical protein